MDRKVKTPPIKNHKKRLYLEVDFKAFRILEQDRLNREESSKKTISQQEYYGNLLEQQAYDLKKTKFNI
jgi:hypothetical protein